jgi:hypothetical protein
MSIVAAPAWKQVAEKQLFGKPYIRVGKLFTVVGVWVYQQGGALGYGLRAHPALLIKLLGVAPEKAAEYVAGLGDEVRVHLAEAEAEGLEKTFFHLYVAVSLRRLGIDILAEPASKELDKKADRKFVEHVTFVSWVQGAAFGYHLPESFRECWKNTYRMRLDSEWQEMRRLGLTISENQQPRSLETAVAELAADAIEWAAAEAPGLLDDSEDDSELDVLNLLAMSAGDIV